MSKAYSYIRAIIDLLYSKLLGNKDVSAYFLVRIDEPSAEVFFLAGEETEILIFRNGLWRFL